MGKKLLNWHIENKKDYCIAHGNVTGNERFQNGEKIHTSKIIKTEMIDETVFIHTKNSLYQCEVKNCCFNYQNQIDILPFTIADYKEKYFKDFPPEKNSITLEFSAEIDDFFKRAIVEDSGKIIELSMSVHVGNFQDSCLIGDGADGGKYDIRYYPNNIIEFYCFDTDNLPLYIVNSGKTALKFGTIHGETVDVPAGSKKLV
jgi:hypothetical protein